MFKANHLPPFSCLLDDQPTNNKAAIAKHPGVTTTTLKRWSAQESAPKVAMLALYYESRWGQSQLFTELFNGEQFARREVDGLKRENAMLRTRIARLEALGGFGAANEPLLMAQWV